MTHHVATWTKLIAAAAAVNLGLCVTPAVAAPKKPAAHVMPPAAPAGFGAYTRKPMFIIEEYHLVKEGKRQDVIDYYRTKVLPVLRTYPGYMGFAVLDPSPPASNYKDAKIASVLGIPSDPIQPHEGVMMDGAVRTDRQIVFHSAIKGAFNLIFHHYIADEATFRALIGHDPESGAADDSLVARWKQMYGTNIWDEMAKGYFSNMKNHYDVVYSFESVE